MASHGHYSIPLRQTEGENHLTRKIQSESSDLSHPPVKSNSSLEKLLDLIAAALVEEDIAQKQLAEGTVNG